MVLACSQFKSDNVEDYPIEEGERVAEWQFQLRSIGGDQTCIEQTARFLPSGLLGMAYWKLLLPLHKIILEE
jgi:hypothetical protein